MNVWIQNPFDNLPSEGYRPQRYWLMAEAFARAGHSVTLWTSDFSHAKKTRRDCGSSPDFRLIAIPTLPYPKNVGLARIRSHRAYAHAWLAAAKKEATTHGRPDLIVTSLPPLATGDAALALKREFGAKLVVDVMDAWPKTFLRLFPRPLRFLAALPLLPFELAARRAYRGADLVTGVCEAYGTLARTAGAKNYVRFYHGVRFDGIPSARTTRGAHLVYAGNLGRGYDLGTVIRAVKEIPDATLDIAGAGEREAEWLTFAGDCPRIRFHGYLDAVRLDALLETATIGVIPLSDDTCVALPYKLGDYVRHGLGIVTSLHGECAALLEKHAAGTAYSDLASLKAAIASVTNLTPDFDGLKDELNADRIYADYVQTLERIR